MLRIKDLRVKSVILQTSGGDMQNPRVLGSNRFKYRVGSGFGPSYRAIGSRIPGSSGSRHYSWSRLGYFGTDSVRLDPGLTLLDISSSRWWATALFPLSSVICISPRPISLGH